MTLGLQVGDASLRRKRQGQAWEAPGARMSPAPSPPQRRGRQV